MTMYAYFYCGISIPYTDFLNAHKKVLGEDCGYAAVKKLKQDAKGIPGKVIESSIDKALLIVAIEKG